MNYMRSIRYTSFFFLLLLVLAGCKTGGNGPEDPAGNEDLKDLPRSQYNVGGVSFSFGDVPDLDKVHRDSVGWGHLLPQTEENGPIVYYFVNDKRILSAPHIRVEYIDKKIPRMGTVGEIHDWLKEVFVNPVQGGQIGMEGEMVKTMDGQEVEILQIVRPAFQENDTISRSQKIMTWAYIDHDDRFVAVNLTTIDDTDQAKGMPLFRKLVRSYKDEK